MEGDNLLHQFPLGDASISAIKGIESGTRRFVFMHRIRGSFMNVKAMTAYLKFRCTYLATKQYRLVHDLDIMALITLGCFPSPFPNNCFICFKSLGEQYFFLVNPSELKLCQLSCCAFALFFSLNKFTQ